MMVAPTVEEPEEEAPGVELDVEEPEMEAPAATSAVLARATLSVPALAAPVRINAMRTPASLIVKDGSPLRWAGALLLIGVILSLVEMSLLRAQYLIDPEQLGGRFATVLIDAILGTLLVLGHEQFRKLASVRAVMGGVIFTLMHLIEGHTFLALSQVLGSAILLTLLSEEPSRNRVRLALGAALGLFVLQSTGIHLMINHKLSAFALERDARRTEALQRFSNR